MLRLAPIHIDEDKTLAIYDNAYCQEIFQSYPAYYYKTGYHPPWVGYFVIRKNEVVGVGGFTGAPRNGEVEVAYGTNPLYEGQGVATFACGQLVKLAKETDPLIIITAKTAPEQNASTTILTKKGFVYSELTQDHEIGEAWLWVYKGTEMPSL